MPQYHMFKVKTKVLVRLVAMIATITTYYLCTMQLQIKYA